MIFTRERLRNSLKRVFILQQLRQYSYSIDSINKKNRAVNPVFLVEVNSFGAMRISKLEGKIHVRAFYIDIGKQSSTIPIKFPLLITNLETGVDISAYRRRYAGEHI
jgi:hypothetical protein